MDLVGIDPKVKVGTYFRGNSTLWPTLWSFVSHYCADIITLEQAKGGYWNQGTTILAWQAESIADRLQVVFRGERQCELCKGTGLTKSVRRKRRSVTCPVCGGKGIRADIRGDWKRSFQISVRKFADFCRQSGGFCIL